jgi:hypothetical protein
MALTVRTILGGSDAPTSLTLRSSMVALPEQVERTGKWAVFQLGRSGWPQLAFPLCDPLHLARTAHRPTSATLS